MLGQNEWIETGLPTPIPPRILRPPGRPKKLRKRDPNEPRNPFKVSWMNKEIKCGKCHKEGHNSRSCKTSIT